MELKDWITIIGISVVSVGWFVNSYLNRRNEIAKKRLEYRLPTLKSFLKIWYIVQESKTGPLDLVEYQKLLTEVREDFHLYGEQDEIELFEEFIKHGVGKKLDKDKTITALEALVNLVRKRIRKELDID